MASKFIPWVDDSNLDSVLSYTSFASDAQRQSGFEGGTPASAIRVNTALRQANLVACALMNLIDSTGITDFRTSVSSLSSIVKNYFETKLKVANATNADNATNVNITNNDTNANANVNFKIGTGSYNKTINNVENVTTKINNQLISNIFETNGTTVKNATNVPAGRFYIDGYGRLALRTTDSTNNNIARIQSISYDNVAYGNPIQLRESINPVVYPIILVAVEGLGNQASIGYIHSLTGRGTIVESDSSGSLTIATLTYNTSNNTISISNAWGMSKSGSYDISTVSCNITGIYAINI